MDKNLLSILEDYKESIDNSLKKIDKTIKSSSKSDKEGKRAAISSMKQELSNAKSNFSLMKAEAKGLNSQENINTWGEIISNLKPKIKSYDKKIKEFENINVQSQNPEEPIDHLNVDKKVDLNQLNAEQVIQRGDKILDVDDNAINNMAQIVNKDEDQMKNVNAELNAQQEKLENIDSDLKEIDYSLKRAGKQISNMFRLYSKDKCIMGLIIVILIIIVVIIIVAAVGGDKEKNFNVPHDIFGSNNKNSTSNSGNFISENNFGLINLIGICFSLMELL